MMIEMKREKKSEMRNGKGNKMLCKNKGRKGTEFPKPDTPTAAMNLIACYVGQILKIIENQRVQWG